MQNFRFFRLSESGDEVKVDEDEEKKKEIKRARRQKTRAAKAQRIFEEKARQKREKENKRLAETQQTEQVQPEERTEDRAPEHPELPQGECVGNSYSVNREGEQITAVAADAADSVPEPQGSSSGQLRYSDDDIIKEEEEDDDDTDEPKELQYIQCREHAKIMFRMLWFDNKGKMAHVSWDWVTVVVV